MHAVTAITERSRVTMRLYATEWPIRTALKHTDLTGTLNVLQQIAGVWCTIWYTRSIVTRSLTVRTVRARAVGNRALNCIFGVMLPARAVTPRTITAEICDACNNEWFQGHLEQICCGIPEFRSC